MERLQFEGRYVATQSFLCRGLDLMLKALRDFDVGVVEAERGSSVRR